MGRVETGGEHLGRAGGGLEQLPKAKAARVRFIQPEESLDVLGLDAELPRYGLIDGFQRFERRKLAGDPLEDDFSGPAHVARSFSRF